MFGSKTKKPAQPQRQVVGGRPPREEKAEATPAPAPSGTASPTARTAPTDSTMIGKNVSIQGDVRFTGTLVVNGRIDGRVDSEGHLVISNSGSVHGEVCVDTAEVSGQVRGDIKAATALRLLRGAEVEGDVECPSMAMEDGVSFQGRCTRPESNTPQSPARATPRAQQTLVEPRPEPLPEPLPEPESTRAS